MENIHGEDCYTINNNTDIHTSYLNWFNNPIVDLWLKQLPISKTILFYKKTTDWLCHNNPNELQFRITGDNILIIDCFYPDNIKVKEISSQIQLDLSGECKILDKHGYDKNDKQIFL